MDNSDLATSLTEYITNEILRRPGFILRSDVKLISSGMIDSFSLVDLALFVEDKFKVPIEDTELNATTFDTIDELAKFINLKLNAK